MMIRRLLDNTVAWGAVLKFLDRPTLLALLSVEKAMTASVAELLYREIPGSVVSKMSRKTPRREVYCDAVRIIDLSIYTPSARIAAFADKSRTPVRFDVDLMSKKIRSWRKRYPQLHTILYRFPDRDSDDSFVIYIGGPKIIVHLESRVYVCAMGSTFYIGDAPTSAIAPSPRHVSMYIRHTLVIRYDTSINCQPAEAKQWIYNNPDMDRRITGIDYRGVFSACCIEFTLDEALSYLALRTSQRCPPLTQFSFNTETNPDELRELTAALGPDIRHFFWGGSSHTSFGNLQIAIDIFAEAFPQTRDPSNRIPSPSPRPYKMSPGTFDVWRHFGGPVSVRVSPGTDFLPT